MIKIEEEVLKKALRKAYLAGIKDCEAQREPNPECGEAAGMVSILMDIYGTT